MDNLNSFGYKSPYAPDSNIPILHTPEMYNTETYPNMLHMGCSAYQYVPKYSPSAINTNQYSVNYECYSYMQQTITDQTWVNSWLMQNNKLPVTKQKPSTPPLKIHEAKLALQKCLKLLSSIKNSELVLRTNMSSMTNLAWEQTLMETDKQKAKLLNLLTPFENASLFKVLKVNLKKRKLKRILKHRDKLNKKALLNSIHEKRRKKHEIINQWLEDQKDNVEKAKREEYLKRDADCVLSEVTKKKIDARRQLALLSSLVNLRTVREKVAEGRGEKFPAEDTATFQTITDRLKNMWERALKTYGTEEQGLKLMLEHKSGNQNTKLTKHRDITNDWTMAIFGPKLVPCDAYWVLTCAWKDLETFVAIRKSWDTFLTSPKNANGSSIPIGWILPERASLASWEAYLEQNPK